MTTYFTDKIVFTEKENSELIIQHTTNSAEKSMLTVTHRVTNPTPELWNLIVHDHVHKVIPLDTILSQLNSVHSLFF
jgi:hypothetical protein